MPNAGQIIRASDFARVVDFTTITANTAAASAVTAAATSASIDFVSGRCYRISGKVYFQSASASAAGRLKVFRTSIAGTVWYDSFQVSMITATRNYPLYFEQYMACTGDVTDQLVLAYSSYDLGAPTVLLAAATTQAYNYMKTEDVGPASDYPNAFSFS